MEQAGNLTIIRTYRQPLSVSIKPVIHLSILERLRRGQKAAVADCIDAYGNRIWAFAKLHMRSLQEAELLSEEIFKDIWIYADRNGGDARSSEDLVIQNIAVRRLIKHKWEGMTQF